MQEKLNFVLLSIWSHIPIDLSVWASNIVYQREIWSLPTGAVDTIFHGQSRITGKIARKNDKNKSISLKLKYFLIAGAHNLKLVCSATYCNMTTNTPCFSRFPIDLTWQPVSAWHHASFWNRKRRWRHRSVRIVNCDVIVMCTLMVLWEGLHQRPVVSPRKGQVMLKEYPFRDVVMICICNELGLESSQKPLPKKELMLTKDILTPTSHCIITVITRFLISKFATSVDHFTEEV